MLPIGTAEVTPGMSLRDIRTYLSADRRPVEHAEALLRAHIGHTDGQLAEQIIPIDACWRIFSEHAALVDDEMHCVFDTKLKLGTTNLFVARMLLCQSVFDAMRAYGEASTTVVPEIKVVVTRRGDTVSVRWTTNDPSNAVHQIALEGVAVVYFAIFSWLAGGNLPIQRVRAPAARRNSGPTLLGVLGAPIAHSGTDLEIVMAACDTQARIVPRDIRDWHDGVYKVLCGTALRSRTEFEGGAFTNELRSALLQGINHQQGIADRLGVSTKTVARRLGQEGCRFRRVRDEIRMQKAISLIHSGSSIEKISDLLGYEDTRSFRRAFKRWFGQSPSVYRSQRSEAA